MRVLDLFSGIGGFSLGLERAGMQTVAFCEIEPFCQKVLRKHWPTVPIYEDVRALNATRLADDGIDGIDVICGGFPCQDISVAGKGAGIIDGTRSGLWSEFSRLIGEIRPRFAIVENVAALLSNGMGRVLGDLAEIGYDAEWSCIPAEACGLPQIRERIWIVCYPLAYSNKIGRKTLFVENSITDKTSFERQGEQVEFCRARSGDIRPISIERTCWVGDGVPEELDEIAAFGNAVVPQIPEIIGRAIMQAEAECAE